MQPIGNRSSSLISKITTLLGLLVFSALTLQAQEQPKPAPEVKKLEIWVGDWTYEGGGPATPFGPAGKFKGKQTCRMALSGFFLETRWEDTSASGYLAQGVIFQGYDAATKSYTTHGFENDGTSSPGSVTVSGNTWSSTGTRTDSKGKSYKTKVTHTFSSDGKTCTEKAEYSPDDGTTWMTFWEDTLKKVGK